MSLISAGSISLDSTFKLFVTFAFLTKLRRKSMINYFTEKVVFAFLQIVFQNPSRPGSLNRTILMHFVGYHTSPLFSLSSLCVISTRHDLIDLSLSSVLIPVWWCRTDAVADFWSKLGCRTNFLSAFAHFLMICQHHKVSFTPPTALYGHAECFFFFRTPISKGVGGCLSTRGGQRQTFFVSPISDRPIYWGLDTTTRTPATARTLVTARTPETAGRKSTAGTPQ